MCNEFLQLIFMNKIIYETVNNHVYTVCFFISSENETFFCFGNYFYVFDRNLNAFHIPPSIVFSKNISW